MSRSKSRPHSAKGPSQRQLRVGELIRHELARVFLRGELRDAELEGRIITCSEVRVSPDLRYATAYVSELGGAYTNEVVAGLTRCCKFLRGELSRHLEIKYTPELKFVADTLYDDAAKMDALLSSSRVTSDVTHDEIAKDNGSKDG